MNKINGIFVGFASVKSMQDEEFIQQMKSKQAEFVASAKNLRKEERKLGDANGKLAKVTGEIDYLEYKVNNVKDDADSARKRLQEKQRRVDKQEVKTQESARTESVGIFGWTIHSWTVTDKSETQRLAA